jgi:hypothetical protein
MIKQAACAAMALCIVSGAQAQTILFKDLMHPKDDGEKALIDIYVAGVRDGLVILNASLVAHGASPLFCLPPKLALTSEQAADILTRQAKKDHDNNINDDNTPLGFPLLEGLKETFPCGGQSK